MILREDMKFLYYNGYSWPHPFTQCVLQHRLKLIRYSLPPVDNSICNQYLRVPDGRQVSRYITIDLTDLFYCIIFSIPE